MQSRRPSRPGGTAAERAPIALARPGIPPVDAEDGPGHFAAPGPHQTGQTDDLAPADGERHVVEHTVPGEALDLQDGVARRGVRLREERVEVAADHRADDVVDGEV